MSPDVTAAGAQGDAVPEYSIVSTFFSEGATVEDFHQRLTSTLRGLNRSYEIVYVNDGSTDDTLEKLEQLCAAEEAPITLVDLFFNAGQLAAFTAGFEHCRGRSIIIIDSDLQLAPEELPDLIAEYEKGFDVVSGYRVNRHDPLMRKIPSFFLNLLIRRRSIKKLRDFGCTMKVFDAAIIRAFEFGPMKPIRPASLMTLVQNSSEVPVTHYPRPHGNSGWRFSQLFTYSLDSIVGVGAHPWLMGTLVGGSVAALSILTFVLNVFILPDFLQSISGGEMIVLFLLNIAVTVFILSWVVEFVVRKYAVTRYSPAYIIKKTSRFGAS